MTARVRNASAGATVAIPVNLSGPSDTDPNVTLGAVTVDLADGSGTDEFTVTAGEPVAERPGLPPVPDGDVLSYTRVGTDLPDERLRRLRVDFEVGPAALPNSGPEAVRLYRFDREAGEWTPVGATYDPEREVYSASFPEPSSLAIVATEAGSVEVVSAGGLPDWVRSGHTTTVAATVANPGDRPADRTLTVTVEGNPVAQRSVSLDPGERRNVTIEFDASPGTVAVEGVEAGRLAVGEQFGGEGQSGTPTMESGGFPPGALLFAAALVVTLAVAALVRTL